MQVVNTGNTYKIYDNSLRTFNQLPAQAYLVNFDKMSGFYLSTFDDIVINEKIYGVHMEKCQKVLKSFEIFERNLGVILSGAKGIGKSLFAKMLSAEAIKAGYPLLIVNCYIPGIADYLTSIQQEVVVLFDEFDKTFHAPKERDSMSDPQSEMLTLFDGLSQGKKLFVVTCNELNNLNNYLVNRPGRFHYHFRFEYPTNEEITEYLQDKIPESAYGEIDKVIQFAQKVDLNYDCLRAIAFELTLGTKFEEAIKDLNILNLSQDWYSVTIFFNDGTKARRELRMDLFDDSEVRYEFTDCNRFDFYVNFNPCDSHYDSFKGGTVVDGSSVKLDWLDNYYDEPEDKGPLEERKKRKCEYILIRRKGNKSLHYAV